MIRTVTFITLALMLAPAMAWGAPATEPTHQEEQEPQDPWTVEEYRAFYNAISKPQIATMEEFLSKYPESSLVPLVRRSLILLYFQNQNSAQAFEVADVYFRSNHEKYAEVFERVYGATYEKQGIKLPTKPTEDFQILYTMVDAANKVTKSNDKSLDNEALRYSQQALALLKNGGAPPTIPSKIWSDNQNTIKATLYQTIGVVKFHREQYDEAVASLNRAGQINSSDPATFYVIGESYRVDKYAKALNKVKELNEQYTNLTNEIKEIEEQVNQINGELEALSKQPSTRARKARIERLQQQGERLAARGKELSEQAAELSKHIDQQVAETDRIVDYMVEVYAKTLALLDGDSKFKQTVRGHLESFYKYRHQGDLQGLDELIRRMKTDMPKMRPMVLSESSDAQEMEPSGSSPASGDERAQPSGSASSPNPQP